MEIYPGSRFAGIITSRADIKEYLEQNGVKYEFLIDANDIEKQFLNEEPDYEELRAFEETLEMTEEDSKQDFDLNRFKNEKMSIDCSNYAGQPHQLGRFGHFYRSEDENYGMSMWLDLPDDSMQFLYRNKKHYENFEAYFVFHRKWGGPDAPEDWEEPYYKNPNSFDCDVTSCQFTFTDEFGNKKEKKTKTKRITST